MPVRDLRSSIASYVAIGEHQDFTAVDANVEFKSQTVIRLRFVPGFDTLLQHSPALHGISTGGKRTADTIAGVFENRAVTLAHDFGGEVVMGAHDLSYFVHGT